MYGLQKVNVLSPKSRLTTLTHWDIGILTAIFFGMAIYQSTVGFLTLHAAGQAAPTDLGFSPQTNYWGIAYEMMCLAMAAGYLVWRRFDFGQLDFRVNRYTLPLALLFGISADMLAGGYDFIHSLFEPMTEQSTDELHAVPSLTTNIVIYSLLNGFYEEVYFLGLLFCVPKRYYGLMYLYSLLIRLSFHTYQGLESAMVISSLGIVFLAYRRWFSVLIPFMLAHSFFDMNGLGATSYQFLWLTMEKFVK